MNARALSDLEVVSELLDGLAEAQLHLLAAYSRLSPLQRKALLRLVADKERLVTRAHHGDQLVTAVQRLTLAHQATLIQLVGSSVEGTEHIVDRKLQKEPTKDLAS